MTLQDVGQVMDVLTAIYPAFYSKQTDDERYNASVLWASLFEPYPVELVVAAVKGFIGTDTKGFPPVPGQILTQLRALTEQKELGEAEAWAMVKRACSNGLYGAQKEFNKLPPLVQKILGSPNQLRDWAMCGTDELDTVIASNFQRAYRTEATRQRDYNALPPDVQALVRKISGAISENPGGVLQLG